MNHAKLLFAGFALMAGFAPLGAPLAAQTLSLVDALRAGESQAPRLAAQRHAVSSAGFQVGRAGELPDPRLKLGLENLPVTGQGRYRYDFDFMTQRIETEINKSLGGMTVKVGGAIFELDAHHPRRI